MAAIQAPRPFQTFERKYQGPLTGKEITTGSFRNSMTSAGLTNLSNADYDPIKEYDYEAQAEKLNMQANEIRAKISQQRLNNQIQAAQNQSQRQWNQAEQRWENQQDRWNRQTHGGTTPPMFRSFKNPTPEFMAFATAISGQESGGNYSAVNPDSGAMGRYQVMPSNIAGKGTGWDYEVLGRDITPQRYLNRPKLQDRIALHKMQNYFRQYGLQGAAAAWYAGPGMADQWNDPATQGDYPSIADYVSSIVGRYQTNLRQIRNQRQQVLPAITGFKRMGDPLKGEGNWSFGSEGDYGSRTIGQGFHTGIDFEAAQGTPVYAAQSGRVGRMNYDSGYGNQVFINGANKTQTRYQHLAAFNNKLKPGDFVKKGQLLGYVGNTGSYSQGNHLHFETRRRKRNTSRFDPRRVDNRWVSVNPFRFYRRFL